jgi:hypothetical protein
MKKGLILFQRWGAVRPYFCHLFMLVLQVFWKIKLLDCGSAALGCHPRIVERVIPACFWRESMFFSGCPVISGMIANTLSN